MEDTQETSNEQVAETETQETVTEQGKGISEEYLANIFNKGQKIETAKPEGESETETDTDEGEEQQTETETEPYEITLKVENTEEKYDLNKEEDVKKIVQFAQKGRFLEKERHQDKIEKQATQNALNGVGFQYLFLQSQGKLGNQDFLEKPFSDFEGASDKKDAQGNVTEEGSHEKDIELWNEHKEKVRQNKGNINDFKTKTVENTAKFNSMMDKFQGSHPEITNVEEWTKENLLPYYSAILSLGYHPYPEDMVEMIYFWKNRDSILKEAVKNERKTMATLKPQKGKFIKPSSEKRNTSAMDETVSRVFKSKGVEIVH